MDLKDKDINKCAAIMVNACINQVAQALYLSRSMLSRHAWSYFLQQPNILY